MGYGPVHLALDVPQLHEAVRPGLVFNGLAVSSVPDGLQYYVRFGNNPESGPWTGKVTWTFGSGVPRRDTSEGLYIRTTVAVPNGRMSLQVSYEV